MAHDVLYCGKCETPVMEGRGDWDCDKCGAYCGPLSCFSWVSEKPDNKKGESKGE